MDAYKKEPLTNEKLKEKNPKALNDDYVKFIRYGQYYIEKNGTGILAFINPHGFLENPTFRGMRWSLLNAYDKIYTIDLHGNGNKQEISPDGSVDQNVFDILQGVSINILFKTGKKKQGALAEVFHHDLYGTRNSKYDFLTSKKLTDINFKKLKPEAPMFFFNNIQQLSASNNDFIISDLFLKFGMGIATGDDKNLISMDKNAFNNNLDDANFIKKINYRLFDTRFIYYDLDKVERGRKELMSHMIDGDNIAFISLKRARNNFDSKFGITNQLVDKSVVSTLDNGYVFPLYLKDNLNLKDQKTPNFNKKIIEKIEDGLKLKLQSENGFTPVDLLDYMYAIVYSRKYRKKYLEHLKVDFPRIPYPNDQNIFWTLVAKGSQLRRLHLMEEISLKLITQYPESGDNVIEKPTYRDGNVYINDDQYFANVPEIAWNFYLGGYQPAQKWLKDRKGQALQFEDIKHYQKIIATLQRTSELMDEIDKIDFL